MKCEWGDCRRKSKLKLSMEDGWKVSLCFMHAYKMLKRLIKQVHDYNKGLYVQREHN